jgi:hypothetical protein
MVRMVRDDEETAGDPRHAGVVGQIDATLRFRGVVRKVLWSLDFSAGSMSP